MAIYNEFSHERWWCSIVLSVYQRVYIFQATDSRCQIWSHFKAYARLQGCNLVRPIVLVPDILNTPTFGACFQISYWKTTWIRNELCNWWLVLPSYQVTHTSYIGPISHWIHSTFWNAGELILFYTPISTIFWFTQNEWTMQVKWQSNRHHLQFPKSCYVCHSQV